MRSSLALVSLMFAAACASAPTRYVTDVPTGKQGRYVIHGAVEGSSRALVIDGELMVAADTITVTERRAHCEPVQPPNLRHFVVRCGDVTLSFDRRDPTRQVTYRVADYRLAEESACIGRRVLVGDEVSCGQTVTDQREVRGHLTGYLVPRRAAGS